MKIELGTYLVNETAKYRIFYFSKNIGNINSNKFINDYLVVIQAVYTVYQKLKIKKKILVIYNRYTYI